MSLRIVKILINEILARAYLKIENTTPLIASNDRHT